MARKRNRTPGPQQHAEGAHGDLTRKRFIEQLHEGGPAPKRTEAPDVEGHHRLGENREQHDPAEKTSEIVESLRDR
jgi:hypothetical protein